MYLKTDDALVSALREDQQWYQTADLYRNQISEKTGFPRDFKAEG